MTSKISVITTWGKEEVSSEEAAKEMLTKEYPDIVFGEWEYNTKEHQRMLAWENEEIAGEPGTGDDGSHAIAEIIMDEVA
jgi:hypothetical protein